MKKHFLLFAFFTLLIIGCKKEEQAISTVAPSALRGQISISAKNVIENVPFQLGQMVYTNNAGNQYRLDVLKYYLSNFEIFNETGGSHKFGNYELIDESKNESKKFILDSIPAGTYNKIKFYVGVDSITNQTLNNPGDLDLSKGMFWTWSTGYIFLKAEGAFIDTEATQKPLVFHLGSNAALAEVEMQIPSFTINKNIQKMNILLDVNTLFGLNKPINFNTYNVQQSFPNEGTWIQAMKENLPPAFSIILED
jgi:hypothetical protein